MPRLIDKIKELTADTKLFFSIEYFPPKTEAGVCNLYDRIERMALLQPCFISVTWGSNATTVEQTLDICTTAQNLLGLETLMHLTCSNTDTDVLADVLSRARAKGIQNIFALRGDKHDGSKGEMAHAVDLVRFIRAQHGDYFGIAVAGYPYGHEESESYHQDLLHLKEKIDAGATLVITQFCFDPKRFLQFCQDCREIGIKCPIIPGLMPIQSYAGFRRCMHLCRAVPPDIVEGLEPIKDNDELVKEYGVQVLVSMIRQLMRAGVRGFHFFSLNLERSITRALDTLEWVDEHVSRDLPWRKSANSLRSVHEDVRPIFWANRPKSYMARTMTWDDFPNGRWGDNRSPAFGECDHHYTRLLLGSKERDTLVKSIWEKVQNIGDVITIFLKYLHGEVASLPWFEAPLAAETSLISQKLVQLNRSGFLTINSQPAVNGVASTDKNVGWGPGGGFVYQKEYVEFFCSPSDLEILLEVLRREEFADISYMAVNRTGDVSYMNVSTVNAVTWGVFPGKEILQPTVTDPTSFLVWKDEAFALWISAFEDSKEKIPPLIKTIHDTWFLVNMVDNDFVAGDLWRVFHGVFEHPSFQQKPLPQEATTLLTYNMSSTGHSSHSSHGSPLTSGGPVMMVTDGSATTTASPSSSSPTFASDGSRRHSRMEEWDVEEPPYRLSSPLLKRFKSNKSADFTF